MNTTKQTNPTAAREAGQKYTVTINPSLPYWGAIFDCQYSTAQSVARDSYAGDELAAHLAAIDAAETAEEAAALDKEWAAQEARGEIKDAAPCPCGKYTTEEIALEKLLSEAANEEGTIQAEDMLRIAPGASPELHTTASISHAFRAVTGKEYDVDYFC